MNRTRSACAIISAVMLTSSSAGSPVIRDTVFIGAQHYLRTQRAFPVLEEGDLVWQGAGVSAQGGICAYGIQRQDNLLYDDDDFLWTFDAWCDPLHDLVQIDAPGMSSVGAPIPARLGTATWMVWASTSRWGRIYDTAGHAKTDPFVVASGYDFAAARVAAGDDRVAILLEVHGPQSPFAQNDQYLRVFSADGTALSDMIPVAVTPVSEERSRVAVASDGSVIAAHAYGSRQDYIWHAYFQRVRPDFVVEDPIAITPEESEPIAVCAQDDGTVLVFYRVLTTGTPCFVRRYAVDGEAVGDPVPIDPGCDYAAAVGDGRFALAGEVNLEDVWVRLYDAAGAPLGERLYFCADPNLVQRRFVSVTVPLAYDHDDGTLWIVWRAWEPVDPPDAVPLNLLTSLKPFTSGDMNGDGMVNNQDIDGFVLALFDRDAYEQSYGLPWLYADFNADGRVNNQDIDGFVAALFGGEP